VNLLILRTCLPVGRDGVVEVNKAEKMQAIKIQIKWLS
jgi:hypothetical protein